MSDSIHVKAGHSGGSGLQTMLNYDLGSAIPKIWVRCQLYLPSTLQSALTANNLGLFEQSPTASIAAFVETVGLNASDPTMWDWWGSGLSPPVLFDQWQTFEFFADSTGNSCGWWKLDGYAATFFDGSNATGTFDTRKIWLGLIGNFSGVFGASADTELYIGKVQIGTNQGLHDVLDYDPSTTAFGGVFGTTIGGGTSAIAMATAPSAPPASMDATPSTGSIRVHANGDSVTGGFAGLIFEVPQATSIYTKAEIFIDSANSAIVGAAGFADVAAYARRPRVTGGLFNDWASRAGINSVANVELDNWKRDNTDLPSEIFTADLWHTVEFFWDRNAPSHLKIDGVVVSSFTGHNSVGGFWTVMTAVLLGLFGSGSTTPYEYWINKIQIGTSDGGSEVFTFDPTVSNVLLDNILGVVDSSNDFIELDIPPVAPPGPPPPVPLVTNGGVRVSIAFNNTTLEPNPAWTDMTGYSPSLVAEYSIDRGRGNEFDPTPSATATIRINDRHGLLDPTNSSSPLTGLIEPDLQILIELWDPCAKEWSTRFRGWIEDYDYEEDPSQEVAFLTISVYDIFALLGRIEMQPGQFGDTPPVGGEATVFFDNATFQDRITQVFGNAGIPSEFFVVFTGNVNLLEDTLSAGSSPMDPIQAAADAEFPGVANVYPDRFGRAAAHGRLAVFDPEGTAGSTTPDIWDYRHWKCGDGAAVAASPSDTAHIRPPYKFNRGISSIINSATASPQGIDKGDVPGQLVTDPTSIGDRGIKSWSKDNLLVDNGILTGNSGKDECKLFATFYVTNYAEPRNRVDELTFRSTVPGARGSAANWLLLTHADIADRIDHTATHPGGGGFNLEPFYIQGVKETATPLNGEYANVTLTLQVTPKALFDNPVGLNGT